MRPRLKPVRDQIIVITGASSGIGLATAQAAAQRGARVILSSRDELDLRTAVDAIRDGGGYASYVVADVADADAMRRLADETVSEHGGLDTWINNAGVSIYGRIEEVRLDDARRLFDTNYWGVVNGSLAALPHLKRWDGRHARALINVGSVLSETAYPLQGHYTASKHAVKGFTDSLRLELEEEGAPVVVTLIQPAAIDTPYPEHAKTYLGVEPKHEAPVYAPEIVAGAILECAEHPHRNLRIGGSAKLYTSIEKLAPVVGDRMKVATSFAGQRGEEPARHDDTLHSPRPGDGRVRGSYPGRVKTTSIYTEAAKHPMRTFLGAAALGVGISLAARALGNRRD